MCTYVFPGSHCEACGEFPDPPWHATIWQENCTLPPLKFPSVVPWHIRQKANPAAGFEGAAFAD